MKKYASYLAFSAVLLVLAAFFRFALPGYRFLALCFLGLAAVTLAYMGIKILSKKRERAAKALRRTLTAVLILGFSAVAVTEGYIVAQLTSGGEGGGCAIVLGAGVNGTVPSRALWARLNAALDYAGENPDALLILSGGQGPGEDISEARCMFDWLTARGVDPERLILEDKSTSTEENLKFSREKLPELPEAPGPVTIVTAGYHIARAKLMAADLGFGDVSARPAWTGYPILELNYFLREAPAIWWYLISK